MITSSEQQYIELYEQARQLICEHSSDAMNGVRDEAYDDFRRQGFPSRKAPIKREKNDAGISSSEREQARRVNGKAEKKPAKKSKTSKTAKK